MFRKMSNYRVFRVNNIPLYPKFFLNILIMSVKLERSRVYSVVLNILSILNGTLTPLNKRSLSERG